MGAGAGALHSDSAGSSGIVEPPRNQASYRITDADELGEGSLRRKFEQTVAAIRLLRTIEGETRSATPEEKERLGPEEHRATRETVLNAHYPSPTVVRAVYAAVGRLGFTQRRVREPVCGLGHFIGLMPSAMRGRSHVTGVEIDPLTARLAKVLYPAAEIRAQAFEDTALATNSLTLAVSNVAFGNYAPVGAKLNPRKFIPRRCRAARGERSRP